MSGADLRANAAAVRWPARRRGARRRGRAARATPLPSDATVIVDPPRTGLSKAVERGAGRIGRARIVYVSCDVATLARDIKVLVAAGFAVVSLEGFDLFPNTAHVETLAVLQRDDDSGVESTPESFSARLAAARKPRNRPWNRPLCQKLSGCHCTATQKRDAGSLDGFDDAVHRAGRHLAGRRRPSSPPDGAGC